MTEYTPTTEHIREYVEVGGVPSPWIPPNPKQDEARVAAFDRWLADHDRKMIEDTAKRAAEVAAHTMLVKLGLPFTMQMQVSAAILAEFKIGGEHKHPEVSNRPVTAEMATRVRLSAATVGELLEAGWTYREAINEPDTWTRPGIADLRRADKIGGEAL